MKRIGLVLVAAGLLAGCASTASDESSSDGVDILARMFSGVPAGESDKRALELADKPLGSQQNPVRANMPEGEAAYLARLRCANGRAPAFSRIGSFGEGPYGMIIDGYDVQCAGSTPAQSTIFIDMYHPAHIETAPVAGFTITP